MVNKTNSNTPNETGLRQRVLRRRNAATYIQTSVSTLDRLVKAGKLKPPIKNGTAISLFEVSDLDRYLDEILSAGGAK